MANPTVAVQSFSPPITSEEFDGGLDAVVGDYQTNEMVGLVGSGFVQRCDDTQPVRFLGLVSNSVKMSVLTGDIAGQRVVRIARPLKGFSMKIASALGTDLGRQVYARFSNEVSFSPGVNANLVGTVKAVGSPANPAIGLGATPATMVLVEPLPFAVHPYGGIFQLPGGANATLSLFHVNKVMEWAGTSSVTVTLPAVNTVSAGDTMDFVATGTASATLKLVGTGTDMINGVTTGFSLNTVQFSTARLVCDGTQWIVLSKI